MRAKSQTYSLGDELGAGGDVRSAAGLSSYHEERALEAVLRQLGRVQDEVTALEQEAAELEREKEAVLAGVVEVKGELRQLGARGEALGETARAILVRWCAEPAVFAQVVPLPVAGGIRPHFFCI